jgi:hypothetical protein
LIVEGLDSLMPHAPFFKMMGLIQNQEMALAAKLFGVDLPDVRR